MTAAISTRVVTDPHTGKAIRVPAHIYAPEPRRAAVPMREWLSRRASLTNPRDAHNSTTPASEAGRGTESAT